MPLLLLHGPLRRLADDHAQLELDAITVGGLLRELERAHPQVGGWILDERGLIRRHVNVFVNGERGSEQTALAAADRVEVLPAITGG